MEGVNKTIIRRAESQIRQQLFGMLALAVVGLMVMNSFGLLVRGAADNTNMTFNVSSGTFSIENAPESIAFPAQSFGAANNITGNEEIDNVDITDYRGTATAWEVVTNANNLTNGTNIISAYRLSLYATGATASNVANFDTNRVNVGSTGSLGGAGVTLINGSTQASGVVELDNALVNLYFSATDQAGNYAAVLLYTLS
ncbi:hypothetical protein A2V68_01620 [candidate division Kazan bacterium RBG_13_50_9]|uniref:Uncharacterized protein n=1 Tax=candidate division Kazan bacterium RBG_13_50_9 TaxID=1798535 RepID=A0A1F4NSG5_UNCK3|nr:MAG: hypothetical protein A2V68_01620 [candidate division Kazan bacterium RBG_13_50_9]